MKKILSVLIMALSVLGFAQDAAPGPKVAFQAFEGASFLKMKAAEDGFHKFSLKVEAAPWAFQAIGEARVVAGDPQLLVSALYEGSIYVIVAYVPDSKAAGKDGKEYNAGVFDLMLYYDDEQVSVRNVKFKLLPPADDEWAAGILKDAMAGAEALGALWGGNYEHEITAASATPVDKKTLQDMNRPKPEPKPEPVAEEEPVAKKMVAEDEETDDDGSKLSVKEKRRRAMMRKKQAAEEEEEAEEPVVKKKKKKKKAVEEDEEEAPVVKKKKKKKKVVEEDAEEDEQPVVKKKKKKKKVVEEEEEDDEEPVVKKKKSKKKKKKKSYDEDEDE
ncbi:MAG: hypothetical protein MJY47_06280 [Fibrobacter sp.]|nr:hypothetical protein [Fibrobacter sp.]